MTRSPATIPWPSAPIVTAASPVNTPARACSAGSSSGIERDQLERRTHRPLRVVSVATGVPQTAITASPMNFSIVPPYRVISVRARSK